MKKLKRAPSKRPVPNRLNQVRRHKAGGGIPEGVKQHSIRPGPQEDRPSASILVPAEERVFVTTLIGQRPEEVRYKMPVATKKRIAELLDKMQLRIGYEPFQVDLEKLIGKYQIFRKQDREILRGERPAIMQLATAHKRAQALIAAYDKAFDYAGARTRLNRAWSALLASRPTHIADIPIKYPDQPELLSQLADNLSKLEKTLQLAASMPLSRHPKGGRPASTHTLGFVREFHTLTAACFGERSPTIRGGPLKRLLAIAFKEVGWQNVDLRPLLAVVENPRSRKKPPA